MEETLELIPVTFEKVLSTRTYTCVVLVTDKHRFAIYTDPASGKAMQAYLSSTTRARPDTHDLLNQIFRGLDIKLKQIVINDLEDTIYFGRLFIEQQIGDVLHIVEIDARPSDCITLALQHKVPVFCSTSVLEKTIPYAE